MNKIQRIISRFFALYTVFTVLIVSSLAVPATAEENTLSSGTCGDNLTWSFNEATGTLAISGTGIMKDYGYENSAPWSEYTDFIKNVNLPDGLESIGNYAFNNCFRLTSIDIPDNVIRVGESAFQNSGLIEVEVPDSVTEIAPWAFGHCRSLYNVILPEGISRIENHAFYYCESLENITIPTSVTSIGECAFQNCISLNNVEIPSGVKNIEWAAFSDCDSFTSVILPDGLAVLGEDAFHHCDNLKKVEIGSELTSYGQGAFRHCTSLTELIVAEGNKAIVAVDNVLFNPDMTGLICYPAGLSGSYTIPDGVRIIYYSAFEASAISSVTFSDSVSGIGETAFWSCSNLQKIEFPANISSIEGYAFEFCENLTEVIFRGDAPYMCDDVFSCVTATTYYPANNETWTEAVMQDYGGEITWVPYEEEPVDPEENKCGENLTWAFDEETGTLTISGTGAMTDYERKQAPWWSAYHDQITSIHLEDNITHIGSNAFHNCTSLLSVSIPRTLCTIGTDAFSVCTSLKSVYITDLAAWCNIDFAGTNPLSYCADLYLNNNLLTECIIPDGVTSIGDSSFVNCNSLTSVTIPSSVTSIETNAFEGCRNLREVHIANGVTAIKSGAFSGCTKLSDINMPGSVTYIGNSAFQNCSGLVSMVIPEGVTSIGSSAFYGCSQLNSITIPNSVTSIGDTAFAECAFTSFTIPKNISCIDDFTFVGCRNLTSITIPENVVSIGQDAFSCCDSLIRLDFEGDAPDFTSGCFYDITATVYYPANNSTWTEEVMQDYGGDITWVAAGAEDDDEEVSVTINSTVGTVGVPEGGWKEGTNTFTVAAEKPCVVALSNDGGTTYIRLAASATGTDNTYSFTANAMTENSIVAVIMTGDTNGDSSITNADITRLKAAYQNKVQLDSLKWLAADVNNSGDITNADVTKLKAVYQNKTSFSW